MRDLIRVAAVALAVAWFASSAAAQDEQFVNISTVCTDFEPTGGVFTCHSPDFKAGVVENLHRSDDLDPNDWPARIWNYTATLFDEDAFNAYCLQTARDYKRNVKLPPEKARAICFVRADWVGARGLASGTDWFAFGDPIQAGGAGAGEGIYAVPIGVECDCQVLETVAQ